jgi:hypothetical protein
MPATRMELKHIHCSLMCKSVRLKKVGHFGNSTLSKSCTYIRNSITIIKKPKKRDLIVVKVFSKNGTIEWTPTNQIQIIQNKQL